MPISNRILLKFELKVKSREDKVRIRKSSDKRVPRSSQLFLVLISDKNSNHLNTALIGLSRCCLIMQSCSLCST